MKRRSKNPRPYIPAPKGLTQYAGRQLFRVNVKLWKHCLVQAYEDKEWAEKHKYDGKWMAGACNMSLDMLRERLANTVETMCINHYRYAVHRAMMGSGVDGQAVKLWLECGGRMDKPGYRAVLTPLPPPLLRKPKPPQKRRKILREKTC